MKRGISPVVAAVLLVIIAVAAGVLVWAWLSGFAQKNTTEQAALRERIKIDAVDINTDTDAVNVYVRNIGDVAVDITSAYVLNATTGTAICGGPLETAVHLDLGDTDTVSFTCSNIGTYSGSLVIVKVVTTRGTEATYQTLVP